MENYNKNTHRDSDIYKILDHFPVEDRADMEDVWRMSKKARRQKDSYSKNEIEEALQNVHFRIEEDKQSTGETSTIAGFIFSNARYIVAAVALIVIGMGIFMIPKTIMVPYAETAIIELPDGSMVEMNSGSTLQYNLFYPLTSRTVSLNGEAYFSVESGDKPFIVEANGTVIEVTGTEFNVRSWSSNPAKETTVTVTEGNVKFYPQDKQLNRVSLKAGQTSRLNPKLNSPAPPSTESADEALAWRENRLVFQETALISILHDLERSFDVQIELDVDNMEYETLTAYYNRPANIETILEDICTVKGLRYTETNNGYRIFK